MNTVVLQNGPYKGNVRTLNLCVLIIDKPIIGKVLLGMSGDVYHTLNAKENARFYFSFPTNRQI